ncbi:MAG: glycoside hydrolase domain-containing protein [Jatrophihabitans sp.]
MRATVRNAAVLATVVLMTSGCASVARDEQRPRSGSAITASRTIAGTSPPGSSRPGGGALTKGGMWWGVDSYAPITAQSLANVRDWYVGGHRPQFWGRYLSGRAGISDTELRFARAHGIYVYLIVPDRNCSACSDGDACTNDSTAAQARADAAAAVRAARRLTLPAGAVLFKDIEEVSSCRDEPTPAYLLAWFRTLLGTPYRTGFYGNVYRQTYEFPTAYCATVRAHPDFSSGVVLAMNEPEPQLGAPRKTIGPSTAPPFRPSSPRCAPPGRTLIWQYGESTDDANLTDVDQARPGAPGLLAPEGGTT